MGALCQRSASSRESRPKRSRDAPLDFVLRMNRSLIFGVLLAMMLFSCWTIAAGLAAGRPLFDAEDCVIRVLFWFFAVVGCVGLRFFPLSPKATELFQVFIFSVLTAVHDYDALFIEKDDFLRHRSMMLALVLWNFLLVLLSFRKVACFILILWHNAHFSASAWLIGQRYSTSITPRFYVTVFVVAALCYAISFQVQGRLALLFSAQCQLAAEKEAAESLLSMVCDAAIWIADDGDTVLRCDGRFDMLLGRNMRGMKLSDCMPDCPSFVEERERLRATFKKPLTSDPKTPVTLLQTKFQRAAGSDGSDAEAASNLQLAALSVDLFVVDRGATLVDATRKLHMQLRYLVGVRVAEGAAQLVLDMGLGAPSHGVLGQLETPASSASKSDGNAASKSLNREVGQKTSSSVSGSDVCSDPLSLHIPFRDTSLLPQLPETGTDFILTGSMLGRAIGEDKVEPWSVMLPIDAEVLVGAVGRWVPGPVLALKAGCSVCCVDRRALIPCGVVVTEVSMGHTLPLYALDLESESAESAKIVMPEPCRLLIESSSSRPWPCALRSAPNLDYKRGHEIIVFEDKTIDVGCAPWRYRLASTVLAPQPGKQDAQVCVLKLEGRPGSSHCSLCVRVERQRRAHGDQSGAIFVAIAGPASRGDRQSEGSVRTTSSGPASSVSNFSEAIDMDPCAVQTL